MSTIIEQELGYLALAVVQAGTYIPRFECGFGRYLEMYRERRGELLEEYRNQVQKIDDYEWTVYTTWTMSFERLSPQAATFLKICAFLHHDGISEAIFQNAARNLANSVPRLPATNEELDSLSAAKDFMNWFRTTEGLWDTQKFLNVIIEIRSYSLIDFDTENCLYSIHPLVHAWTLTVIADGALIRTCTQYILGMSCSMSPTYLNTIQTACPWILRYLASAAILSGETSSRARYSIREIVKVIQTEEYQYQDPVASFLKDLYVELDFEAAQRELILAVQIVGEDFFLNEFRDEFLDHARYLISEAYCRIHQKIDIGCVSNILSVSLSDASGTQPPL